MNALSRRSLLVSASIAVMGLMVVIWLVTSRASVEPTVALSSRDSGTSDEQARREDAQGSRSSSARARETTIRPLSSISYDDVSASGTGVAEAALEGPAGSWNSQAMADALMSENFDQWVRALGKAETLAAREQARDYGDAVAREVVRIDGRINAFACGNDVCAMEVESRASGEDFSPWLSDVFSDTGLPAGALMTYPLPGNGSANRYRVMFVVRPGTQAVTFPTNVPPASR